ncbi:MAG TPA: ribonuclease J [Myxococcota bacterium]|mgnify:FL=1|nr:ribonuclease J [Myxococcota bacterium]
MLTEKALEQYRQSDELMILPMGGFGEIGMNMTLFGYKETWFIVDAGVQFCDVTTIGAEVTIQDLDLLKEFKDRISAIFVTHGHEDHIGAIEYVVGILPVPVYASPFVCELIKLKASEFGAQNRPDLIPVSPGATVDVGPMTVGFVRVTHSIPDSHALVIDTPVGKVVYSGDFKIDPAPLDGQHFDKQTLKTLGDQGVRLLLADSTNAMVPGRTSSEQEVIQNLMEIVKQIEGRVIISLFASNVYRVRALIEMAHACGRRVALVGRSLGIYQQAAERAFKLLPPENMVDPHHINRVVDSKIMVLCTGSQAEPRSALYRASNMDHPDLRIKEGDTVILSSRIIPGNEKAIGRMTNNLVRLGAHVINEKMAKVHASGHAYQDELRELLELVRPQTFVPIHGEYAFMRSHAELAESCGVNDVRVLENGDLFAVDETDSTVLKQFPLNFHFVDGPLVGDAEQLRLSERKRIAWSGVIAANLKATRGRKKWIIKLDVQSVGIPILQEGLMDRVADYALEQVEALPLMASAPDMETCLVMAIRSFFRREMDKKPVVLPFVEIKEP